MQIIQRFFFVLRFRLLNAIISFIRNTWFSMQGMKIGSGTKLPTVHISWPHQVKIGKDCRLETNIAFKFDGIWKPGPNIEIGDRVFIGYGCEFNIKKSIKVGDNCLIASGCRFIDHDHGIKTNELMRLQLCDEKAIIIGENVWIGANAIILKGVHIEDGTVIAAGAVVNKSIPSNEIWAGVPAKKIGNR